MSIFRTHKTSADRSAEDKKRHKQKIEKSIKEGIHDIVADESIIGQDGKKTFKIPVRGIKEYKFVYGDGSGSGGVGTAKDDSPQKGEVIAKKAKNKAQGQGSGQPGQDPGEEFYEVEITLDELAKYLFDDLELPDLEKKRVTNITGEKLKKHGCRKKGIVPRLDKKRTLINKIKRQSAHKRENDLEEIESLPFNEKDLMYKYVKSKPKENSNAVLFFVMDTSGSMSKEKKYLARSFYFLIYQFIRYRYESVEIVFISHDTEAREVNEEQFFTRGSSGGTYVSPAFEKVDTIIKKRYHPDQWNIYTFYCSDGDNWSTDNQKAAEYCSMLKNVCQMISYCEIEPFDELPRWRSGLTTLMEVFSPLADEKFKIAMIHSKEDIWPSFKRIFGGRLYEQ